MDCAVLIGLEPRSRTDAEVDFRTLRGWSCVRKDVYYAFGKLRATLPDEPETFERVNPESGYKERVTHLGIMAPCGAGWRRVRTRRSVTRKHFTVRTYGVDDYV